jgi:APA family basic amino acid/polyamine antiporter
MSESVTAPQQPGSQPELRRVIGPKLLLFFVVGDILGTGIYALTGTVAGEVGGAAWMSFGVAFIVAMFTATSYLELVGKYPRAAGAALYTHKAFGIHLLTFMVAFTVMSSGLTSAGAASRAFGGTYLEELLRTTFSDVTTILVAIGFLLVLAAVNFRGVAESVYLNVILTCIELSGLLIILIFGFMALGNGIADAGNAFEFSEGNTFNLVIGGAALAFFAMVGFEDSVNMAEETNDPPRTFPRALFAGILITGVIYMLVAFFATAIVPLDVLGESSGPLLEIVRIAAAGFPLWLFSLIALFAVSNSALINLMMASRLIYGMARQRVIPEQLGIVHPFRRTPWVAIIFTTLLAMGLATTSQISTLGGTTSLLLLAVFAIVNTAVLVLRRDQVSHYHFKAPTIFPILGIICCVYLIIPGLSGRPTIQYIVALVLLAIGFVLWLVTWIFHGRKTTTIDPTQLTEEPELPPELRR